MTDEMITAYDERGREIKIPKDEWVNKILPDMLRKSWNDPDRLYEQIVQGLKDGFADKVMDAAIRLKSIDPRHERGAVIMSIVQMQNGFLKDAEASLRNYIRDHGETGVVLTNLAKVLDTGGDKAASEKTLRQALHLDPNQDNGLDWWGAIHHERGGMDAYLAAMKDIANEPGSWLAQLWIARHHLEKKEMSDALTLYREVLAKAPLYQVPLMMITGDLGNVGLLDEMLELIMPVYNPQVHDPYTGLNLARAAMMTGRLEESRHMITALQTLKIPPLAEALANLEKELSKMSVEGMAPQQEPPQMVSVPIRGPVWMRGLNEPWWLVPTSKKRGPKIGFFPLADQTRQRDAGEGSKVESENDTGRLSRALPLYLAEALTFQSNADAISAFGVVQNMGPAVFGELPPLEYLIQFFPGDLKPDYLVSGVIGGSAPDKSFITLQVWNVETKAEINKFEVKFNDKDNPFEKAATFASDLIGALKSDAKFEFNPEGQGIFVPPGAQIGEYMLALAQLLIQLVTANKLVDPKTLWNERGMFETYLNLAEQMPGAIVPKIMQICGVLASLSYGSPVAEQYKKFVLEMLDQERDWQSPIKKLAPIVYKKMGMEEMFAKTRDMLLKGADGTYKKWLESC